MLPSLWRGETGLLAAHPWREFRKQMDNLFERYFGKGIPAFDGEFDEMRVWDFGVDPRLGDNPGSIGPLLDTGNRN